MYGGTAQCLPPTVLDGLEQQDLARTTALPSDRNPGGQHPGVVQHDQVTRADQRRQVPHHPVLGFDTRALIDEQPRGVARFDRGLGDAVLGEVVVELLGPHRGTEVAVDPAESCAAIERAEASSRAETMT